MTDGGNRHPRRPFSKVTLFADLAKLCPETIFFCQYQNNAQVLLPDSPLTNLTGVAK